MNGTSECSCVCPVYASVHDRRTCHKESIIQCNMIGYHRHAHFPHRRRGGSGGEEERRKRRTLNMRGGMDLWHLINISCSVSNFLGESKTCAPIRCISVIGNSHLTMETKHWIVKQDYSNNRN